MKINWKALIPYAGLIAFMAIFIWKCPSGTDPDPVVIPSLPKPLPPVVKTDSVKKALSKIDTFFRYRDEEAQKPDTVILYELPQTEKWRLKIDTNKYLRVIDSLNRVITTISYQYILLAPNSPKILSGEFSRDKLRLNLLKTQGDIEGKSWPLDYSRYRYVFDSTGLKAIADPLAIPKVPKFTTGYTLNVGYDFLHRDTRVRMDYSIMHKNFGAYTGIGVQLGTTNQFQTEIGLRIKLK